MTDPKSTGRNGQGKFRAGNPGRPKGAPNKLTIEFRETVRQLLENNSENVAIWLEQVANGGNGRDPNPAKALEILAGLAEFAAPKLSRTEHTGPDGGAQQHTIKVIHE